MKLRYKTSLIGLICVFLYFVSRQANKPFNTIHGHAKITYKNDTIMVKQKGKKSIKVFQPDPKSTVIKTDDNGNISVKVKQIGFGFDPAIGIGYSNMARLALDTRFFFYKRFGLNAGLGVALINSSAGTGLTLLDLVSPYVGLSYTPLTVMPNTAIVVSYMLNKTTFVFIRVRM